LLLSLGLRSFYRLKFFGSKTSVFGDSWGEFANRAVGGLWSQVVIAGVDIVGVKHCYFWV